MSGLQDFRPVLFLTIVVCIAVATLTVTNMVTHDLIEEANRKRTLAMLEDLFPEMTDFELDDENGTYTILQGNDTIGYAFEAKGKGYGGPIQLMIGIEPDLDNVVLRGISVGSHSETPGLGAKIKEDWFQEQFQGVPLEDVHLKKDGGQIDAISGATISSNAVVDTIQDVVDEKVALLKGGEA